MHIRALVWGVATLVAAGVVFLDARRLGMKYENSDFGPVGWAVLTFLIPLAVVYYAWQRRKFLRSTNVGS